MTIVGPVLIVIALVLLYIYGLLSLLWPCEYKETNITHTPPPEKYSVTINGGARVEIMSGPAGLRVTCSEGKYAFEYLNDDGEWVEIELKGGE